MLKILIRKNHSSLREAAETFVSMYVAVCGITLEIVLEDDLQSDLVVLGTDMENPVAHDLITKDVFQSIRLRSTIDDYRMLSLRDGKRDLLRLSGGNIRAVFYAVYDFFERVAGCHYFWDGDVIPLRASIPITGLDVWESPRFEYRGLRYFAHRGLTRFQAEHWDFDDWKKEFDWVLKKRLNLTMLRIGLDDVFQRAFPEVVPYPRQDQSHADAVEDRSQFWPGSFNDRSLFWPLEYRGELRKKVLTYGRSRGLIQPEDCGTMTHWYSRTPQEFLDHCRPDFFSQSSADYGESTNLVWDIRKDENLERYWKLTEAHIEHYGDPAMFHTIGLAERNCYTDRKANLEMKLYAYQRIIGKLREHYPHAPLLIGSWDFLYTWQPEEVRELVNSLDPSNTILLDYTSDGRSQTKYFNNWGVVGKFPWIFGIFHAYQASSEPRGMYDRIAERLPVAAADPMCRGLVFWPENSHQDTLMLDFFPSLAWNPADCRIESFIPDFCSRRYPQPIAEEMAKLWLSAVPLLKLGTWSVLENEADPLREVYPDMYFTVLKPCGKHGGWLLGNIDEKMLEYFRSLTLNTCPHTETAATLLETLVSLDPVTGSEFQRRDTIDLARMVFSRFMSLAIGQFRLMFEDWRDSAESTFFDQSFSSGDLLCYLADIRAFAKLFSDLLESSGDFSLGVALQELHKRQSTNPDFEKTLKNNANNGYCRSHVYELARYCYEPEFAATTHILETRIRANDRSKWVFSHEQLQEIGAPITQAFHAKPLAEMAPDIATAIVRLPHTLNEMATLIRRLFLNSAEFTPLVSVRSFFSPNKSKPTSKKILL